MSPPLKIIEGQKGDTKMAHISPEAKEAILAKALSRDGVTIKALAEQYGVGCSTLNKWLAKKRKLCLQNNRIENKCSQSKIQIQPLEHILATENLDEEAIGAYCRIQGIHSFQLKQWRESLMTVSASTRENKYSKQNKELRDENKKLKKDLNRKDKALAEASALLILKKKAHTIWGELVDD
jgi:transposase